jgi:hypothetical protein
LQRFETRLHRPERYPDPGVPARGFFSDALVALLREEDGLWHSFANLRGGP